MYACTYNQESHTDRAQQQIMGIWLKVKEPVLKQGFAWLIHRSRPDSVARQAAKRSASRLILAQWIGVWVI